MSNQPITDEYAATDRPRKPSGLRGNWQLMVFDEYGRAIQINNLQRNLLLLGVMAAILFLTAVCFAGLFFYERSERLALQSSFTQIQGKVSALINENDALMARLAVVSGKKISPRTNPDREQQEGNDMPETSVANKPLETAVEPPAVAGGQ